MRDFEASPFEVKSFNDGDVDRDTFSNGLCCHMVAEDTSSFGVKPHDLIQDASSGQYEVSNFTPSTRVTLGAAILRRVSNKWSAVGVLSSSTADTFRPVWLSRENFSNLIRTGEPITVIENDPVVYEEQSNTAESQQSPPIDLPESPEQINNEAIDSSVTTPTANDIQNGGREISTVSDQSRNELRDDQGDYKLLLIVFLQLLQQNKHLEEQREPERIDGGTPNEGRSEEINRQGEPITAIEVDPVVYMYAEQSNTAESLQSPPIDLPESSEQINNEAIDSSVTTPTANGIQNGGREISTVSDERIDGGTPNGGRSEEINRHVLYIGDVVDNATLMDELARCLDREYRVLKYWKHLAYELHIPILEFQFFSSPDQQSQNWQPY
ncbi:hypothetical protein OS493_016833 [Desmophyllum pertusum]|uniref:Uncharacterized protein n=1 Tax=Desmophyllum pertusum TaxID=174260 RepID=A0A9W9YNT3_9CNID|nr:hypothetical protein OS493_016833 [Desmophyllum pertusum]